MKQLGVFRELILFVKAKVSNKLFVLINASTTDEVAHTCNPILWEAKVGRSRGQEFETSLANMVKPRFY